MLSLIQQFVGRTIGINLERSYVVQSAELVAAEAQYFTVRPAGKTQLHHIPYSNLIELLEDPGGTRIRHLLKADERFEVVIKVGHVV
ncbi:MAG TPA: hypothetical protein ENK57_17165, partial [Polyangiaceae bacterium]|nr:hypothetical protein [Polyangiaceae bacterium]